MLRSSKREATRIERVASSMNTGALVDFLVTYANSLASAVDVFKTEADPIALDVVDENTAAINVIVAELRTRTQGRLSYLPAPDPHLERLLSEYARRGDEPA